MTEIPVVCREIKYQTMINKNSLHLLIPIISNNCLRNHYTIKNSR